MGPEVSGQPERHLKFEATLGCMKSPIHTSNTKKIKKKLNFQSCSENKHTHSFSNHEQSHENMHYASEV